MATAAILKILSLKIMCTHVRQNFWEVSSNSEHLSKPTMNINSQHHNLLGNQISPKSEDFCIWWPFYTLDTMTATAILNFFNPQKLPHTTVDIPTKWIIIWLPKHGYQFPTSKSIWKPIFAQIGGFLYFVGHFGFQMATIANQQWISNLNFIIYLETKFRPNRGFFVFWQPFWIQNGHHSKPTMDINSQHHNLN